MLSKKTIHEACVKLLNEKINSLQNTLKDLSESAGNETKSTAGDKHETALAMLQIEQEKTSRQLQQVLHQLRLLENIDYRLEHHRVGLGSLVRTNHGYIYIGVALGKMSVDDTSLYAISAQSPLGSKLSGLQRGGIVQVNGLHYSVEELS